MAVTPTVACGQHRSRARRTFAVAVVSALAVALSACGSDTASDTAPDTLSDDAAQTRTFTAYNGEFEIPAHPQRIVAINRAVVPLLEADAPLVGITDYPYSIPEEQRAEYDALPRVGTAAGEIDVEAVAALEPDLIISGIPVHGFERLDPDALATIAPVLSLGPGATRNEPPAVWPDLADKIVDAAGLADGEASTALQDRFRDTVAGVAAGLPAEATQWRWGAVSVIGAEQGTVFREYSTSWNTNIVEKVGIEFPGEPSLANNLPYADVLSFENLPTFADVDAIVYPLEPDGSVAPRMQEVLDSPLWQNLAAVQAGRAVGVRFSNSVSYGGAIEALESFRDAVSGLQS